MDDKTSRNLQYPSRTNQNIATVATHPSQSNVAGSVSLPLQPIVNSQASAIISGLPTAFLAPLFSAYPSTAVQQPIGSNLNSVPVRPLISYPVAQADQNMLMNSLVNSIRNEAGMQSINTTVNQQVSSANQKLQQNSNSGQSFTFPQTQLAAYTSSSQSALASTSRLNEEGDDDEEKDEKDLFVDFNTDETQRNQRNKLSRHVTSVVSHFTSSNEGYQRLLNEIDDLLMVVQMNGLLTYTSPAITKILGYTDDECVGKEISLIINDLDNIHYQEKLVAASSDKKEYTGYARFKSKNGYQVLLEIKTQPIQDQGNVKYFIQTAREYRSKATLSIDSMLKLRLDNFKLKKSLEKTLLERGLDPTKHPLLAGTLQTTVDITNQLQATNESQFIPEFLHEMARKYSDQASTDESSVMSMLPSQMAQMPGFFPPQLPMHLPMGVAKKRPKLEELFCRQCGTTNSPEWRRGPDGPKTQVLH